jgi:hypothetical protein
MRGISFIATTLRMKATSVAFVFYVVGGGALIGHCCVAHLYGCLTCGVYTFKKNKKTQNCDFLMVNYALYS